MQQIYRRTPIPKCDIEIELRHGCSPVNLLHFFRTPFPKNTSGQQLLAFPSLRQFLATKSPLKMMENAFYLTLKTPCVLIDWEILKKI